MDDNTPLIRINPISLDLGTIFDVVCDRVDCQVPARLRNHVDALGRRVVVRNGGLHPVDEVRLLIDGAGEVHPHALVQSHLQGLGRLSSEELVVVGRRGKGFGAFVYQ